MAFRRLLASLLLVGFASLALAATAPQERARVWRDQQGREIVGRVVGIQGATVILRSEGRDVAIDYSQLSANDQAYLQGKQFAGDPTPSSKQSPAPAAQQPRTLTTPQPPPPPEAEPREWTVGAKQIVGAWIGADEEAFYIQTASGETRIGYEVISSASDATEVSARLTAAGREDLAQRVVAAYERNSGRSLSPPKPDATPSALNATDDNAEPPFNQNVNVATEPTDMPARPEKFDIATADEVFADKAADANPSAESGSFRNRALLGAFVLVALVSAVLTYGWMSTKRD